jgi:ribonuclease-3
MSDSDELLDENLDKTDLNNCYSRESLLNNQTQAAILYTELTRKDIEDIIGFKPIDLNKYRRSFVHKSVVKVAIDNNMDDYMKESYERNEFLGDAVLNLVVAKFLYMKYSDKSEGYLTRIRTKLVNGKTLAMFANNLKLNKFLVLNYKVENINGRTNNRILEDVFESLICSIYNDLGFNHAEKFILNLINKYIDFDNLLEDDNYKDILLRFCQNKFRVTPEYEIIEQTGPPHNRTFKIICIIQNNRYNCGIGKSKKIAEQQSAYETLKHFKQIS